MEQSLSWEAVSRSANQKLPRLLRNPKIHHRVHNSPPLDPTHSLMNSVYSLFNIPFNIILSSTPSFATCSVVVRFMD
jgi:hypothetical protein